MSNGDKKKVRVRPRRASAGRAGAVKPRQGEKKQPKKQGKKAGAVKARRRVRQSARKQINKAGKRPQKVVRLAGERVSEQTSQAVKEVAAAPEADKLRRAVEVIKADPVMTVEAKQNVFARFLRRYATLFDLGNCPDDYQSLKLEAKFLIGMSGHTFVVLAQRLTKIRELKLYEEDGYTSFAAFVDGELSVARRTVYVYMDILKIFGEKALNAGRDVQYSKLAPAVSLLKADQPEMPKEEIKKEILDAAKVKTHREMVQKAKELKSRYGVTANAKQRDEDALARLIQWFLRKIPRSPTDKERREIIALIGELQQVVSPPTI